VDSIVYVVQVGVKENFVLSFPLGHHPVMDIARPHIYIIPILPAAYLLLVEYCWNFRQLRGSEHERSDIWGMRLESSGYTSRGYGPVLLPHSHGYISRTCKNTTITLSTTGKTYQNSPALAQDILEAFEGREEEVARSKFAG
jgi:hypothetical protein